MPLVIGADEAGYGPNLGPLVVAISVWRVPDSTASSDWYELLERAVRRLPGNSAEHVAADMAEPIAIADSKQLYDPTTGIKHLERGVLAAWSASSAGRSATSLVGRDWKSAWSEFDPAGARHLLSNDCHAGFGASLPIRCDVQELDAGARLLAGEFERTGVELLAMRARGVFPDEFNRRLGQVDNKAELLSLTTLNLVRDALADHPALDAIVHCDKHGGRNRYGPLLQQSFPGPLVRVRRETAAASNYHWTDSGRRVDIDFQAGGESLLPVALASMTAKYLRELAMAAFNAYWQIAIPGLKSTAGYPIDARRFKREIAGRQAELGIADGDLWRAK